MPKSLPKAVTNLYRLFTDALEPPQLPHHHPGAEAPGPAGSHPMSGAPGDGETGSGEWDMLKDRGELGGGGLDGVLKLLGGGRVSCGHGGDEEAEVPFGLQDPSCTSAQGPIQTPHLFEGDPYLATLAISASGALLEVSGGVFRMGECARIVLQLGGAFWGLRAVTMVFFHASPILGHTGVIGDAPGLYLSDGDV
ncbi:hypothetical protein C0991_002984 [Blastosporella zonata]|nr:hypothetical protein C0991_002984 [Blastosporella zonata]